jgi:hypothetical protein
VVLSDWNGDGPTAQVSLAVFVNRLVNWIWAGSVLMLLGTVITLWRAPEPTRLSASAPVLGGAVGVGAADRYISFWCSLARADALDDGVRRLGLQLQCAVREGEMWLIRRQDWLLIRAR